MLRRMLVLASVAALSTACGIDRSTGVATGSPPDASPAFSAVKFWEVGATVDWNERATALAAVRVVDANRMYAYLALAQFRAAAAADAGPGPHPPISAAIGAASVAVLSSFFPLDVALLEAALDAQQAATPWPGAKHADFSAGEAIGRAVGALALTFSQSDGYGLTNPLLAPIGPPPIGPGRWIYGGGPIARGGLGARPFFLASGSQVRPLPPPAFGSAAFNAALAEVRLISDTRTAAQIAIANYWNVNASPRSSAAIMGIARELIVAHKSKDDEAARIMFLVSAAAFDASIGCFDAKYHYWFVRPPQADAGIVTVFPTPPHPSYPSAHSCIVGAQTAVLAAFFEKDAARLEAVALEASLSRLYAGIHFRFDMDAGRALGRQVAELALSSNLNLVAPLH